jgi:benzoyl-CoA reductase/2-hydroxyglutaryl-CoA dehydratase subunit BcrC/BadD/HgdB
MKKILYNSQYIPPEWIKAHGLEPVNIQPSAESIPEALGEGVCPFAEAVYQNALSKENLAVIFTTRCDQMRRISELYRLSGKETFLMNVPSTWENPVSVEIYKDELLRLSRFLTRLSGNELSIDRLKSTLKERKNHLPLIEEDVKKIALMGGPEVGSGSGFIKILEDNSANIALDATEQGEISQPDIDFENLDENPVAELANAYFAKMPDIAKRPNTQFYEKVKIMIKERGIDAIIVRIYPWCDLWHAEVQRIKEFFDLPVLHVTADINVLPENDKRLQTRLNAFMEML